MQVKLYRLTTSILILIALVFTSCLGGPSRTPATRFFVLHSQYSEENSNRLQPVTDLDEDIIIGVGPIRLSQALDRPQIIIRTSYNEIRRSDLERWAMPLKENIINVLTDNLTHLLTTGSIIKFPWKVSIPIDYQIVMEISRFDGLPGGSVDLRARWGIIANDGKTVLANQRSIVTEAIGGDTIAEMVSAQSLLVAKLSLEIAQEINRLEGTGARQ